MLGDDLAADEEHHKDRDERDRKDRRRRHREGLREGERPEQPSLLRFQREDRHERDGDDEQAEEQRRSDLLRRLDQDVAPVRARCGALQMLVRVLDHHHRAVDHRADGDGDAAEAHDIGPQTQRPHGAEGHQDADRQHQDRDEGAPDVKQEHDADERDDDALLEECMLQGLDRGFDETRAVVDRHDLRSSGQARDEVRHPLLDVVDHVERVRSEALQRDAASDLALAVEIRDTAPLVRPEFDARDVPEKHRRALVGLQDDLADVVDTAQVAASAHDELEL